MPNSKTHLPVRPVQGSYVTNTPLQTALSNPVPVINPSNGVTRAPIPAGGTFDVPFAGGQ